MQQWESLHRHCSACIIHRPSHP